MAAKNTDFSKIYSYSKLNLFDKCKKQYHFNYLDPLVAPIRKQFLKPRDYKTKGQAVHGAITLFYYLPEGKKDFDNLKKCLLEAWVSEVDALKAPPLGEKGGFRDIGHERKVYWDSLRLLKNFLEMEKEVKSEPFYMPVEDIRNSFPDYEKMIKPLFGEVSISGKFDRIDKLANGNLRIVDFKTGKEDKDNFQLEFYKLLAEMNYGIKVDEVCFYYLEPKKVKSFDFSNTDSKEIEKRISKKIEEINNFKEFLPEPGKFCFHCDFREICPAFKKPD